MIYNFSKFFLLIKNLMSLQFPSFKSIINDFFFVFMKKFDFLSHLCNSSFFWCVILFLFRTIFIVSAFLHFIKA